MKLIDTFSNRLQKALDFSHMKQVDLVEKTGLDKTLINKYLAGLMKAKQDKLTILAEALNVNEVWLMGYDIQKDRNIRLDKFGNSVVSIPLLGEVRAGYNYLAEENWLGTVDIKEELAKTGDFFALKIKGDSMFETLWEDDIVAVKKQDFAETNDIVVAIINGDEATVKMYKTIPSGIMLQPLNRNYDDMIFSENDIKNNPVLIIGIVEQILERNLKNKKKK